MDGVLYRVARIGDGLVPYRLAVAGPADRPRATLAVAGPLDAGRADGAPPGGGAAAR